MLRVGDLPRSIDFYTQVLGMRLLRRKDYESGRFTNAFMGFEDESKAAVLELTRNVTEMSAGRFGPSIMATSITRSVRPGV